MWLLIKTIKSLSYFKGGVMRGKDSFPPHIVSQQHANAIFAILQKKSQLAQGLIATQVDGNYLFSRVVSNQISSTCKSLTFVFGMGTSGTSQLLSPSWYIEHQFSLIQNNDSCILRTFDFLANCYAIIAFLVNVLHYFFSFYHNMIIK